MSRLNKMTQFAIAAWRAATGVKPVFQQHEESLLQARVKAAAAENEAARAAEEEADAMAAREVAKMWISEERSVA